MSSTSSPNSARLTTSNSILPELPQASNPDSESMRSNPSLLSQLSRTTPGININDSGQSFLHADHQEQTGFPPDAVVHAMAYNGNSLGVLPTVHQTLPVFDGDFMHMKRDESTIDFAATASRRHLQIDTETDKDSNEAYFLTSTDAVKTEQPVDLSTLRDHEISIMVHTAPRACPAYPDMHHQHQSVMACTTQKHRKRADIICQQQQICEHQAEQPARLNPPQILRADHSVCQTDTLVEKRISCPLLRLRQGSLSQGNRISTLNSGALPHMVKQMKDENDMDEDERFLMSEEGRKLSSKERRRIRNKIMARSFRLRRKQYITQLEREVVSKMNENKELRSQNRALAEENSHITDLIHTLLSFPRFPHSLNDLSANGLLTQLQSP